MTGDHRDDLRRAGLEVLKHRPWHAGYLSLNEHASTVSDRRDGQVLGYVSPAFTEMTAEEWLGWHAWPVAIPTLVGR
jgi:hypothetical protein